ncbi:hypothetical protein AURANDRAFT_67324 [Aureococcus anophagefferens]|uniref:3-hydroxyisobutyryl-CoA hydrolase n=1 Tax=Aureococcus anophagefferens TaxID=44056 RepID=F0YKS0_AURAN|nr:hypothetical protein AURANDRAFT_67324 [Aureococcus anophagefferens]EGB04285.1 hypothetical protein AURANDRAFT_67324 [Aureococcus anophagefferens]|eukprot:XP_009040995.1 hypothetical protein AURANDRAFT_67324 [Aureococcus anophagefferens]
MNQDLLLLPAAQGIYGSGYLLDRIQSASILSISVLQGSSIGGGLLLGLATDHRIATRSATFRLGVAPYGLSPVVMATAVLPKLVGHNVATRMYVEDLSLDAQDAMASGIVSGLSQSTHHARMRAS